MAFLTKKANLKKLLDYIIEEPDLDASHNRGHRHPFVVSDILSSDNSSLLDTFFNDEEEEVEAEAEGEAEGDDEESKDEETSAVKTEEQSPNKEDTNQENASAEQVSEPESESTVESKNKTSEDDSKDDQTRNNSESQDKPEEKVEDNKEEIAESAEPEQKETETVDKIDPEQKSDATGPETAVEDNQEQETKNADIPDAQITSEEKKEEKVEKTVEENSNSDQTQVEPTIEQPQADEVSTEQPQNDTTTPEESKESHNEEKVEVADSTENKKESSEKVEETPKVEDPVEDNTSNKNGEDSQEHKTDEVVQSQDENGEKENKPIEAKPINSSSPGNKEDLGDSKTAILAENTQEEPEKPQDPEEILEGEIPAIALEKEDSKGSNEKVEDIDETPIEDALPEDVNDDSDTKSQEHSTDGTTQVEDSEVDPVSKRHIMDILFDFIRTDEELIPILCGYFSKFLLSLMNHNRSGFFSYVLNPDNQVMEYMIKHVYNRSLAETLTKILNGEPVKPDHKKEFALGLINSMDSQEYEGKLNAAMILSDIVDSKGFKEVFCCEGVNIRLFELLRSTEDLTVRATLNFMNVLYKKFPFYRPKMSNENDPDNFSKMYLPNNPQNNDDMVIMDHIDKLLIEELKVCEELIEKAPKGIIEQQYGEHIKPFGATRSLVVKFITNIICVGNAEYAMQLSACLPSLLQFCINYPWNSMLHNNVEIIFDELFKKSSKYKDEIRTAVIAETGLADFIADIKVTVNMVESGREIRNGVMATFVVIANMLNNHESEYVQAELQKSEKWIDFTVNELQASNENNEKALAGHQSKACDSDEESANYETSMDKLFAVFTNLKESHDSSRDFEESDEEDHAGTDDILKDLNKSDDKSDKDEESKQTEESNEAEKPLDVSTDSASEDDRVDTPTLPVGNENNTNTEPKPTSQIEIDEEEVEENNTFYDNSYWKAPCEFDIETLLKDTNF
jgi:hypothetical protein